MPCSVTITMHSSSPRNNKSVSCFVTIHGNLPLFHSFRRLSQFLDTWEWNLSFAKSSKLCSKLESSCYWQVQEQLGQEHKHSSFTVVSEYSQGVRNSQLMQGDKHTPCWRVRAALEPLLSAGPWPGILCSISGQVRSWEGFGSRVSQAGLTLAKLNLFESRS